MAKKQTFATLRTKVNRVYETLGLKKTIGKESFHENLPITDRNRIITYYCRMITRTATILYKEESPRSFDSDEADQESPEIEKAVERTLSSPNRQAYLTAITDLIAFIYKAFLIDIPGSFSGLVSKSTYKKHSEQLQTIPGPTAALDIGPGLNGITFLTTPPRLLADRLTLVEKSTFMLKLFSQIKAKLGKKANQTVEVVPADFLTQFTDSRQYHRVLASLVFKYLTPEQKVLTLAKAKGLLVPKTGRLVIIDSARQTTEANMIANIKAAAAQAGLLLTAEEELTEHGAFVLEFNV
ncbi:MAG: class I SAM-dependent methyltransferase [bacterium]